MRYAIYWTWNDGFEDTAIVYSAKERDVNIKDLIDRKEFKAISYCPIYANGEYGSRTTVLENNNLKANKKPLTNLISSAEKRSSSKKSIADPSTVKKNRKEYSKVL